MFPRKPRLVFGYLITASLFLLMFCLMGYRSGIAPFPVLAQEADCQGDADCLALQKQIDDLNKAREMSINATKPLQGQLMNLQAQLKSIEANLQALSDKIDQKQKDLEVREDKLAEEQALLQQHVRSFYIRSYMTSPLMMVFSSQGSGNLLQELSYRQVATQSDEQIISSVTRDMVDLVKQKDKLQVDQTNLAAFKVQVDKNAAFLDGEIKKAQAYQADLSNQIAQLSAKQEALIAAKLASLNIPRTAYTTQGGCVDDRGVDPGFSPRFALFTYGVPNRVGLNQYGAKGRAEAGQSYGQILGAYYQNYDLTNHDTGTQIHVVGTNNYGQSVDTTLSVEDYLKHIYEMPSNWPAEALKAQAVAARSYVLAATNNGASSICPSDSCQEFKQELNSQAWIDAVNATSGKVMAQGGNPIKAWFSSTHGGYVFTSADIGWSGTSYTKRAPDTTSSVSGFSDLQNNAYDKGSPWFYCDWGSRSQYSNTAWLKPDELADIVNVIELAKLDSSTQPHLSQIDKPNPDGVDTWNPNQVKQELRSRGGTPMNTVSDVSIGWDSATGRTTSVQASGDTGSETVDGSTFQQYFNLRAPANIQIVGPLFNVEKK